MPLSQSGQHFSNPARARMQDNMDAPSPEMGDDSGEESIEVKKKADGSFCTVENGEEMEHPDLESAMSALQQKFDPQEDSMGGDPGDENDQY